MRRSEFATWWDEERVRRVLAYYGQQAEEEAVAEDEAAFEDHNETDKEPNTEVRKDG